MPDQTSCSIYDTLPTLDSWYETTKRKEQEPAKIIREKKTCLVSFSSEPPLIHQYQIRPQIERRSSSSESGKYYQTFFFFILFLFISFY